MDILKSEHPLTIALGVKKAATLYRNYCSLSIIVFYMDSLRIEISWEGSDSW